MKKRETLEEILEEEREFTEEETKIRVEQTIKLFRVLVIFVGAMIALLVILGILFGG